VWRSWLARTAGGREVAGSSPVTPTKYEIMKQLKFNHSFAELIRQGKKTATFRMYDDKDLAVDDHVELLDKVDPHRPATWKSIGIARIDSIVEKRLAAITDQELRNSDQYVNQTELLAAYRKYYGDQVSPEMPVKVVEFSVMPNRVEQATDDGKNTTVYEELILYTDGGSRGNPGPSAAGYVIMNHDNKVLVKRGIYLGITTNNQAEYTALRLGLEELLKMRVRKVHIYMDSMLVVNQMLGVFKVKNRDLWPVHDAIKGLVGKFDHVTFTQVPRALNKLADAAVNESLDAAANSSS
jgi:ribonuclease HI